MRIAVVSALLILSFVRSASARVGFDREVVKIKGRVLTTTHGDLDGDGQSDLLVAYRRGTGLDAHRYLGIFFRRKDGFASAPSIAFEVPKQAILFDLGQVDGRPGLEVLYMSDTGVWAHSFAGGKGRPVKKLISVPTLLGYPEPDKLARWNFARELEGRDVVFVPGRREFELFTFKESGFKSDCRLNIQRRTTVYGPSDRWDYALMVTTRIPSLSFAQLSEDDNLDFVTHQGGRISVHLGDGKGCFSRLPDRRQLYEMRTDEEIRNDSATVSSEISDLDRDGHADLVLTKVGGGLTRLRTVVKMYRGDGLGGFEIKPAQSLESSGFGAYIHYGDIDADGSVEMVQPKMDISIVGLTKILLSSRVTIDVLIRRAATNGPSFFEAKPTQTLQTTFGFDFSRPSGVLGTIPVFEQDFDGDGVPDALLSKGRDEMGLHRGQRKRSEPFMDDASLGLNGPGSFSTAVIKPNPKGRPELVVWFPDQASLGDLVYIYRMKRG